MSITVTWLDVEQTIVNYRFVNDWTWNEFETALETGFGLTESVPHAVTAIMDFSNSTNIPNGAMIYWRKMMRVLPQNQQNLIFIANDRSAQTTIKLFMDINKRYLDMIKLADSHRQAESLLAMSNTADKVILVIEDEDDLREEIVDLMDLEGYRVIEADNGMAGLKLAKKHLPTLIISDVSMPHMDGFQLIEELRKQPETEHVPVVLLTARADRSFVRYGMEIGADDYITKPFANDELTNSVKSRLRRIHALQNPNK